MSVLRDRLASLDQITPYVGNYYSNEWVRKHVLYQSDADIEEMDEQNMGEQENPLYQQPGVADQGNPDAGSAPPSNASQGPSGSSQTPPGEQAN
jgi:hypothetical protein